MAFTTLTGSDGITSLVGTTGVDTATIVSLNSKVFVGGNTGNDTIVTQSGTGSVNLSDFNVRMGGGDDGFLQQDNILSSFISLDGETLANDGDDTWTNLGGVVINSEVVGRGGNDTFTLGSVQSSTFNGNTGVDTFTSGTITLSNASILGGKGEDIFTIGATGAILGSGNVFNGNKGGDNISVVASTMAASTLFGGQGADILSLTATIDGNTLSGDIGDDILTSSATSDDILLGGDGSDALNSAGGSDTFTGGGGTDTFFVTAASNGATDFISITDFTQSGTNADLISFALGAAASAVANDGVATGTTSSNVDLATNLAAVGGLDFTGGAIQGVVMTAGADGAGFVGTYIAYDASNDGVFGAGDQVVKVNAATNLINGTNVVAV